MRDDSDLPDRVDLVVIGAGIIGLSIAYEAVSRGHRVLVVEKHAPGAGATFVAAGMLAPVTEAKPTEAALVELGRESLAMFPDLVRRVERDSGRRCRFLTQGVLLAALDRDHLEVLAHEHEDQRALGLEARRLTGREVLELEPRLRRTVVGGLLTEAEGQVDPRAMSAALVNAVRHRGGHIVSGAVVDGVELEDRVVAVHLARAVQPGNAVVSDSGADAGNRARGETGTGFETTAGAENPAAIEAAAGAEPAARIETEALVVAAGSWSHRALPQLAALPLRPVKGQLLRLDGEALIHRMVRTPEVYLVPRESGELIVGASSEEQGFDQTATAGVVMELLQQAWRLLPGIFDLELREVSVGLRPALRDHLPAIGPIGPAGLYVATGHYRNGILLAPATARYLVDTIEAGATPAGLAPFAPERFGSVGHPDD